jgi:hypothetical protein
MTWIELHDLCEAIPGTSSHLMRHGVAAALRHDDEQLKAWINAVRGLSPYSLCWALDHHGVEVPSVAVAAVRQGGAHGA